LAESRSSRLAAADGDDKYQWNETINQLSHLRGSDSANCRINEFNTVENFEFKQLLFYTDAANRVAFVALSVLLEPAVGVTGFAALQESLLHLLIIDIPRLDQLVPKRRKVVFDDQGASL
jgi:hypothetical protein